MSFKDENALMKPMPKYKNYFLLVLNFFLAQFSPLHLIIHLILERILRSYKDLLYS